MSAKQATKAGAAAGKQRGGAAKASAEKEVCHDYSRGLCARGDSCRFSHDVAVSPAVRVRARRAQHHGSTPHAPGKPSHTSPRLFRRPSAARISPATPASGAQAAQAANRSGGICFDFTKGVCNRGDACRFSHDSATVQAFTKGRYGPLPPPSGSRDAAPAQRLSGASGSAAAAAAANAATAAANAAAATAPVLGMGMAPRSPLPQPRPGGYAAAASAGVTLPPAPPAAAQQPVSLPPPPPGAGAYPPVGGYAPQPYGNGQGPPPPQPRAPPPQPHGLNGANGGPGAGDYGVPPGQSSYALPPPPPGAGGPYGGGMLAGGLAMAQQQHAAAQHYAQQQLGLGGPGRLTAAAAPYGAMPYGGSYDAGAGAGQGAFDLSRMRGELGAYGQGGAQQGQGQGGWPLGGYGEPGGYGGGALGGGLGDGSGYGGGGGGVGGGGVAAAGLFGSPARAPSGGLGGFSSGAYSLFADASPGGGGTQGGVSPGQQQQQQQQLGSSPGYRAPGGYGGLF
jgi:hypothetical protein